MKVLLCGVYHPNGLLLSFERALGRMASVTSAVENILEVLRADNFRLQAPVRGKNASQVFLAYQKNFSYLMMLDSIAKLFAQDGFSFGTRLRGLFYVGAAVRRRLRQMV